MGTNISLSAADPTGKIMAAVGVGSIASAKMIERLKLMILAYRMLKFQNKWTSALIKHIFEGDIVGGNGVAFKVTGVHYKTAIKKQVVGVNTTGDVRIKNIVDKGGGFYDADVEAYFDELYQSHLNQVGIAEDMKGWKAKSNRSTFFPDSWSQQKIKEELAWAYGNYRWTEKTIGTDVYKGWIGISKEGFPIEFKFNTDGGISSAYANFIFK